MNENELFGDGELSEQKLRELLLSAVRVFDGAQCGYSKALPVDHEAYIRLVLADRAQCMIQVTLTPSFQVQAGVLYEGEFHAFYTWPPPATGGDRALAH